MYCLLAWCSVHVPPNCSSGSWWAMTQTHTCALPPTQVVFLFLTSLSLACREVWGSQRVSHGMFRSWQALASILPTDHKVQSSLKLRLKFLLTRCHYRWGTWDWEHVMEASLGSCDMVRPASRNALQEEGSREPRVPRSQGIGEQTHPLPCCHPSTLQSLQHS